MKVVRLAAWCDVDDLTWRLRTEGRLIRTLTFDVHELAVLAEGRRLTRHRDRGRHSQLQVLGDDDGTVFLDPWDHLTEDEVRRAATSTVLTDGPGDGAEPQGDHPDDWFTRLLAQHQVAVTEDELRGLPYDVELGPHLLGHSRDDSGPTTPTG